MAKARSEKIDSKKRVREGDKEPLQGSKLDELPESDVLGALDDAELELDEDEESVSEDDEVESDAELDPFPEIDTRSSDGEDSEERGQGIDAIIPSKQTNGTKGKEYGSTNTNGGKGVVGGDIAENEFEEDDDDDGDDDNDNDDEDGFDSEDIDNWDEEAEDGAYKALHMHR